MKKKKNKTTMWLLNRFDTNLAVQTHVTRGWKF